MNARLDRANAARTAIVTGGAKGICRVISDQLAGLGWHLWLCDRDAPALDETATWIRERHAVEVGTQLLDLREPGAVDALFAAFTKPDELPSAMICGAADYGVLGPLATVDFAAWKRSFDLNFFSVAEMIQRYVRHAMAGPRRRRSIVVMGGGGLGSAQVAGATAAYSCAKAALNRLVEVVHEEVNGHGIDINCLLPGLVNTGMVDQAIAAGPVLGPLYEASLEVKSGGGTPPETAAEFVAQLLTDGCGGVSGRLFSAKWDRKAIAAPEAVKANPDLFRLRRIDDDLFGKKK